MKLAQFASILFFLVFPCFLAADDWARFRGANGSGVGEGEIPIEWSSNKNLKWSADLPGKGTSSPIVHGDRIYVTCYTGYGMSQRSPGNVSDLVRHLIAFDRNSGKEIWRASVQSTVDEDAYQGFITQHGYASSTPTTDGEMVYALFGKSGLFAFDTNGKQVWQANLGTKSDPAKWGDGTSPILYKSLVIVNAGILGNKFVALDKKSGKQVWAIEDNSFTNCWSTPTLVQTNAGQQMLFNVPKKVVSVNPETGEKNWEVESPLDDSTCGCIVSNKGNAYLMGSRVGNGMAIECSTTGDVIWQKRLRSGICTPIIIDDNLYWSSGGIFYAASTKSGEYVYKSRLPRKGGPTGGFPNADYSSPVAVGSKIIQFTRNGESYVIEAGQEFKILGHNAPFDNDDSAFSSSPAISDGQIFIRSEKRLYCIAAE